MAEGSPEQQNEDDGERVQWIEELEQSGIGIRMPRRRGRRRRQRLAVDDADHPLDACGNAAGKVTAPEFRRDDFVDDAPGGDVVERAFEAVADLDAELVIVLGDHQ